MKPFLMGSETEYAITGYKGRQPVETDELFVLLNRAIREDRLWLPDVTGRGSTYLENGGRFYLDYGGHPEYASPECCMPTQIACYDKAGEGILRQAMNQLITENRNLEIVIHKNNLSSLFPDQVTWGSHESYTCWVPLAAAAAALIPHLVTRIVYAGAGCLSGAAGGMGFELSQRARHLNQIVGTETTRNRAIFCTRVRKQSDLSRNGWTRAHLIGKDSHRAPFGSYLTFGTTGLLFLLLNAGRKVGQGLELAQPLAALKAISKDPWLRTRVPLKDGRQLSALEIQEAYLSECEREVPGGEFPEWVPALLGHWRKTVEGLAKDPLRLAGRLDPYCKLLIYQHELHRAHSSWDDLNEGLAALAGLRGRYPDEVVRAVVATDSQPLPIEAKIQYNEAMKTFEMHRPGRLERLQLAVRLTALDHRYHELGGLFDQLFRAGHVQGVVLNQADIDRATCEPPAGSRAAVRGDCIKVFREKGWVCDWRYLHHPVSGNFMDLRDPFCTERRLVNWSKLFEQHADDPDIMDINCQLSRL